MDQSDILNSTAQPETHEPQTMNHKSGGGNPKPTMNHRAGVGDTRGGGRGGVCAYAGPYIVVVCEFAKQGTPISWLHLGGWLFKLNFSLPKTQ